MEITSSNQSTSTLTLARRILVSTLRIFFKLLYHQLAWSYDSVAWVVSAGNWQKWVEAVVPYLDGPRILEVGFGTGHLQLALQHKEAMIFGLDESRQMVEITRRRLIKHNISPCLVRADTLQIPLVSECVNQVVMTFPAEYIIKPVTLNEIRRVLIPRGKAVVLTMAWITGSKPWERLVAWVNRITGQAPEWDPEIIESLKPAGFEVGWEMINLSNSRIAVITLTKI